MRPLTYLVAPYTSKYSSVKSIRYHKTNQAAAYLIKQGYNVFSPISHSVVISEYIDEPNDSSFWVELDLAFLPFCQSVHVLTLPGWDVSSGVARELGEAKRLGLEIFYLDPAY
mgnify:CR=1 FL=1